MAQVPVEDRLRQFGADLDLLADRCTGQVSAPPTVLVDLQEGHARRRGTRVVLVAAALALIVVVAVLLIRSAGTSPPASGPPTWQRLDAQSVGLPKRVNGGVAGTIGQRFIVVDSARAVWTSSGGTRWARNPLPNTHLGANVAGLATAHGRSLVWTFESAERQIWSSRDGLAWREVRPVGLDPVTDLSITGHDRTFIATGSVPNTDHTITGKVWTSHDGIHWTPGTLVNGTNQTLVTPIWFDGHFIALGVTGVVDRDSLAVWESPDGSTWTQTGQEHVPNLGSLYAPPGSRNLYGIQYETILTAPQNEGGTFGGRLMTSTDGVNWTEIRSFHNQLPVANPDHILRTHGWWILSGNTGSADNQRRTDIWWSRDLKHWNELPKHLQGAPNSGVALPTAATRATVLGTSLYYDHALWRWQP